MAFFLKHWADIKKSETMTQIWQQIRLGKHVGFEDGKCGDVKTRNVLIYLSLATHSQPVGVQAVCVMVTMGFV